MLKFCIKNFLYQKFRSDIPKFRAECGFSRYFLGGPVSVENLF